MVMLVATGVIISLGAGFFFCRGSPRKPSPFLKCRAPKSGDRGELNKRKDSS
jgi:hypothetical protein